MCVLKPDSIDLCPKQTLYLELNNTKLSCALYMLMNKAYISGWLVHGFL